MKNTKVVEMLDGTTAIIRPNWNKYTLDPVEAQETGKTLIADLDDWFLGEMMKMPDVVGRQPYHDNKIEGQDEFCDCPTKWLAENAGHPLHAAVAAVKDAAVARPHLTVDPALLPDEGTFKEGREFDPVGGIKTNMAKARSIKLDRIRRDRDKKLAEADVNYMKADEAADAPGKSGIAATKQSLRDLPATIQPDLDAITDLSVLNAYEPAWPI